MPDHELEERQQKEVIAKEEASKDQTWESFLKQYTKHIEKKVDASERISKRKERDWGHDPEDNVAEVVTAKKKGRRGVDRDDNSSKMSDVISEDKLKNVPANCHFTFLRKNVVSELQHDYVLVNHPFPTIQGEMLIYQPNLDQNELETDKLIYKDFSLKKRVKNQTLPIKIQSEKRK